MKFTCPWCKGDSIKNPGCKHCNNGVIEIVSKTDKKLLQIREQQAKNRAEKAAEYFRTKNEQ
jgi:hypothetical protein